ncbi:DNA-binding protein [Cantharellus anzutake]|uniref:DNA-binding protein n=1 Tax=Cantharellus anzutake TaxID=1750568 RepID=UPI001906278A|nr:DNA-binding protein [Cantharellus anzutake]KAF8340321.1 DNA-binding protein [Cantharellus anzutake]
MALNTGTLDATRVTIPGSVAQIIDYLKYAINGILFHRGVYPSEDFLVEKRFGLNLLLTVNDSVEDYIESTLIRLKEWISQGRVSHVVVVLIDEDDGHTIERWVFDISVRVVATTLSENDLIREMNAVMKDIITPTFLPSIETPMVFNILTYAKDDVDIPDGWEATHPHSVIDGEHDTLKAFNSLHHTLGLSVVYRDEEQ